MYLRIAHTNITCLLLLYIQTSQTSRRGPRCPGCRRGRSPRSSSSWSAGTSTCPCSTVIVHVPAVQYITCPCSTVQCMSLQYSTVHVPAVATWRSGAAMVNTNLLGFVFLYSSDQPEPSLQGMVKSMTVSFRAVTLCTIVYLYWDTLYRSSIL